MNLRQQSLATILGIGSGLLGFAPLCIAPSVAITQSCSAATCPDQQVRVVPGQWVNFEIVNRTGGIISIEQPSTVEAIALSPGQRITLSGSTKRNASFLFWETQGLSVEARIHEKSQNNLQIELLWGNGFGNYSVYLRDDGLIEVL